MKMNQKNKKHLLYLLAFLLIPTLALLPKTTKKNGNYLHGCADSFSLMPRPLFAIEDSKVRWGVQFSVIKTILTKSEKLFPFMEIGISLFDKVDSSPNDKKHLFWKGGLLYDLGKIACSVSSGLLYGNEKFGPTIGAGIWKFWGSSSQTTTKKPSDFKNYTDYLNWRQKSKKKRSLIQGYALSFRINYNFTIEPAFTAGLYFDIFF